MFIAHACIDPTGITSSRYLMFRSWFLWLSLLLIAASVGWFWWLTQDLRFSRIEPEPPAATADKAG